MMRVVNQTLWRTDHLKAILQRAAEMELEPAKRAKLVVHVTYTRGGHSSGCAYIGGRTATVRIRHPHSRAARYVQVSDADPRRAHGRWSEPDGRSGKVVRDDSPKALTPEAHAELVLHFASVAVHEFAHIRGMRHSTMPANYKWHGRWREYVQWAAAFPLEVQPVKTKAGASVADKLAHVRSMKRMAETRLKRATTLLRKWKRKEQYYLKAASRPAPSTD